MSLGMQPGLEVYLPDVEDRDAEKHWAKYIKEYGDKPKRSRKTKEYLSDDLLLADISRNPVDVYARAYEDRGGSKLVVWFDMGSDFLNRDSNYEQYAAAEELMLRYALYVAELQTEDSLDDAEKELKKRQDHLKRLKRKRDGYLKDIEDAKARIKKAEQNLVENKREQEQTMLSIEEQERIVNLIQRKLKELKN